MTVMNNDTLVLPGAGVPDVSICIPHYQVQDLMRLCLSALRHYTDGPRYEIIVVDNGSHDGSLPWLRSIKWITLVERGDTTPDYWVLAMNTALDIGLQKARGRYYLVMHSDTIVKRKGWLNALIGAIEQNENVASAGSGKLEGRSKLSQTLHHATDTKRFRFWLRRTFLGDSEARLLRREPCARDHCALYRTDLLRRHELSFVSRNRYSAGETVHYELKRLGYCTSLLPVREMMGYMDHISHATSTIVPERKHGPRRTFRKTARRLRRLYRRPDVDALLRDAP